jgi:predicted DNA-binding protein (MmcQ/YjbR family)
MKFTELSTVIVDNVYEERDCMSLKSQLQMWHALWEKKNHLSRFIPLQEERLRLLKDRISESSVLSSMIQQTVNMDMPRGTGVSDKVGNMVASTLDKVAMLEIQIAENKAELLFTESELDAIEVELSQLSERHQTVLRAYYRDHIMWHEICRVMNIEKSRLYDMINESVRDVELFRAVE